jgi:phosphatidylethanolamine N-methyltransferase
MWLPVHDEEWDGDVPLGTKRLSNPIEDSERGILTFKGDQLPWSVGQYEVRHMSNTVHMLTYLHSKIRYHHDGKYNVLSLDAPIEIYGTSFEWTPKMNTNSSNTSPKTC